MLKMLKSWNVDNVDDDSNDDFLKTEDTNLLGSDPYKKVRVGCLQ
jgi:hypothetical protein